MLCGADLDKAIALWPERMWGIRGGSKILILCSPKFIESKIHWNSYAVVWNKCDWDWDAIIHGTSTCFYPFLLTNTMCSFLRLLPSQPYANIAKRLNKHNSTPTPQSWMVLISHHQNKIEKNTNHLSALQFCLFSVYTFATCHRNAEISTLHLPIKVIPKLNTEQWSCRS